MDENSKRIKLSVQRTALLQELVQKTEQFDALIKTKAPGSMEARTLGFQKRQMEAEYALRLSSISFQLSNPS